MDLTVLGAIVAALASISIGDLMEGGNPVHVLHITSLIIIIPTTLFAAMVSTAPASIKAAYRELGTVVFKKSTIDLNNTIKNIISAAMQARRDGILSLESYVNGLDNEFMKQGLMMAMDGADPHDIEETMEIVIEQTEEYYHGAAHYWLIAGETAPTMGLVGAVLGLILALQKLDNPAEMAAGIGGAFTATVTGIMGSYVLFGPWGNKMKNKSKDIIKEQQIILVGVLGIVHGDNPRALEAKLLNYIPKGEEKKSQFE